MIRRRRYVTALNAVVAALALVLINATIARADNFPAASGLSNSPGEVPEALTPAGKAAPVGAGNPLAVSTAPLATKGASSALEASHEAKPSAGLLVGFSGTIKGAVANTTYWLMVFDLAAVPANGTVAPAHSYPITTDGNGVGAFSIAWNGTPDSYSNGIAFGLSTTCCFTYTAAGAFVAYSWQVQ